MTDLKFEVYKAKHPDLNWGEAEEQWRIAPEHIIAGSKAYDHLVTEYKQLKTIKTMQQINLVETPNKALITSNSAPVHYFRMEDPELISTEPFEYGDEKSHEIDLSEETLNECLEAADWTIPAII